MKRKLGVMSNYIAYLWLNSGNGGMEKKMETITLLGIIQGLLYGSAFHSLRMGGKKKLVESRKRLRV